MEINLKPTFLCNPYHQLHAIKSVIFRFKFFNFSFNSLVFTLNFVQRLSDGLCRIYVK